MRPLPEKYNMLDLSSDLFRHADIRSIVNFGSTIGAGVTRIFKNTIDLRIAFFGSQLASMKITMFFRIGTTLFGHGNSPWIFPKDYLLRPDSQLLVFS
jgi:hypothetical protein